MINTGIIKNALAKYNIEDKSQIREILTKARKAEGLDMEDVAALATIQDQDLTQELFAAAKEVKEGIYGNRLVLFAPLYISNLCTNECLYCAFRASNKALKRRSLNQAEIKQEVIHLVEQGQKRILLVAGEAYNRDGLQYVLDSIKTIYSLNMVKFAVLMSTLLHFLWKISND